MKKHDMPLSTATLTHDISGDVGGNSQVTTIEVTSDGGQFPFTELECTESGFKLKIFGTWEASEFMHGMALMAKEHEKIHFKEEPAEEVPLPTKHLLKYVGIDNFNRPVFVDSLGNYCGSLDKLFKSNESKENVLKEISIRDICFFGKTFDCEPMGFPIREGIVGFVK